MYKLFLIMAFAISMAVSGQETAPNFHGQGQEERDFTLYPNPAFDNVVYITTQANATKIVSVYDVFGKVVLRDRITGNSLNISRLVPGVYVIKVVENTKTMCRKLVVK